MRLSQILEAIMPICPHYLINKGIVHKAIAGEVAKGPFESAIKNVRREGVSEHITVRYADGLFAIEENDYVDTVTIAGMGGALIASILKMEKSCFKRLNELCTAKYKCKSNSSMGGFKWLEIGERGNNERRRKNI